MQPRQREDTVAIPLSAIRRVLAVVIVLAILTAAGTLAWQQRDRLLAGDQRFVDTTTYQAVFLTGGQAYFGKLTIDGDVYVLRDVYYINPPAEGTSRGQLVRRGTEVHGPVEPLVVPARSVLFFENMREDSDVMAGIRLIRSGQAPVATPLASPTR